MLDYGCGEATAADRLAHACGHLTMVEAAPNVRAAPRSARYAGNPKISVLTPEEAAALPAGSFDLIVLHSVAQYLSGAELDRLLATFRKLLKPDGLLVVGDVVPPRLAAAAAAWSLTQMRRRQRFLLGGGRRADADFRVGLSAAEKTVGLSHYGAARDAGKAQSRRLFGDPRATQYRPQSVAHDVSRPARP